MISWTRTQSLEVTRRGAAQSQALSWRPASRSPKYARSSAEIIKLCYGADHQDIAKRQDRRLRRRARIRVNHRFPPLASAPCRAANFGRSSRSFSCRGNRQRRLRLRPLSPQRSDGSMNFTFESAKTHTANRCDMVNWLRWTDGQMDRWTGNPPDTEAPAAESEGRRQWQCSGKGRRALGAVSALFRRPETALPIPSQ
eukprot:scaffold1280_cov246-Pinguiococcus_pyrenoidosus.AAC.15